MALYLFVSKHEVLGTSENPEVRMVLRPVAGQSTYRSRGLNVPLYNRRLQMELNDRTFVCNHGVNIVYALWQPSMDARNSHSCHSRNGRLAVHTRNGERMLVYSSYTYPQGAGFVLLRAGLFDRAASNFLATNVHLDNNMLESDFRERFGQRFEGNGEDVERYLQSLRYELEACLQNLQAWTGTATDSHTAVGQQADAMPTSDSVAEHNDAIAFLQTQSLDYSKIHADRDRRREVFKVLDNLALGVAEFDYYKADGSVRHAKGTRNPDIIFRWISPSGHRNDIGENLQPHDDVIELIRYFDMDRNDYRTFNVNRIVGLSLAA